MSSVAGTRFATVRTAENFRAWATEEPQAAATWLKAVAHTVGARDDFAAEPAALAAAFDTIGQSSIATLAARRIDTMGWSVEEPVADAPAITGTVQLVEGLPVLETSAGRFSLVNADFFKLESNDWTKNYFLGGRDVAAFAGQTVTVKGWPDESWAPGTAASLVVEEFSPGSSPDFVSGRVIKRGDDVIIRVRPGKDIEITDPELKAALIRLDQLGIILPGAAEKNGDQYTFGTNPDGYYILAGFNPSVGPPVVQPPSEGARQPLQMFAAHGKSVTGSIDKAAFVGGAERRDRHYVFGKFVGGQFEAKGYSPYAGGWTTGAGVKPAPSAQFVEWATPIEAPADAPFAPPPPPAEPPAASLAALTPDQRWAGYLVGGIEMKRGFGQEYPQNAARLGKPLEPEPATRDARGEVIQRFERGVMKWSEQRGMRILTYPTPAELQAVSADQRWAGYDVGAFILERGFGGIYPDHAAELGLPTSYETTDEADGAVQTFERGVMRWDPRLNLRILPPGS